MGAIVSPAAGGVNARANCGSLAAMATDTIERMRVLALEGMALRPAAPLSAVRKRRRDDGAAPACAGDEPVTSREPLTHGLRMGAELEWKRATHAWVPSLERLVARGVMGCVVRGCDVAAVMPNGTQRAQGLPAPWVGVVVAMLTGRELPVVRAALRGGQREFTPEEPRDE